MRCPTHLICTMLLAGCGPAVSLPAMSDGSDQSSGSSAGSGEDSGDAGGPSGGSDGGDSGGGSDPMPPVSTVGTDPVADGSGDSTGLAGTCITATELFEAPTDALLFARDQDADGIDEMWLFFAKGGPGSEATAYAIDHLGIPTEAAFIEGFPVGLFDFDGDGLQDLLAFVFDGGPPSLGYYRALDAAVFDETPVISELDFQDGFTGFVDLIGDPAVDLLRSSEGSLELLENLGNGVFEPRSTLASTLDNLSAVAVDGAPGSVVVAEIPFVFDDDPGCFASSHSVLIAQPELAAVHDAPAADDGTRQGPPLRAQATPEGGVRVYTSNCEPTDPVRFGVSLRDNAPGAMTTPPTELVADMAWATVGDFDGDGTLDLMYAIDDDGGLLFAAGLPDGGFTDAEEFSIGSAVVQRNTLFVLDSDGDGRDELIRGTGSDDGSALIYDRIEFEPC